MKRGDVIGNRNMYPFMYPEIMLQKKEVEVTVNEVNEKEVVEALRAIEKAKTILLSALKKVRKQ